MTTIETTKLVDADIDRQIVHVQYHQFPGTTTTVACCTLANGFSVIGQSACVDPRGFDMAVGQRLAFADARSKVWHLEGYLLRERIWQRSLRAAADGGSHE